ncbi:hypothetical protein BJF78_32075 [Pseudonocardia sp. CNS-139]|nr:hypothetical protein BJF78_32075 [Pseudonocardia sp. CNS-139]
MPSSHAAVIDADVVANSSPAFTEVAAAVVAMTCAWHGPVPSHRASPVAVLVLRRPSGPAVVCTAPVAKPKHPSSGQATCEAA